MLTIKIEENPRPIADELKIELPENSILMSMKDGDTVMGAGVMTILEDYAEINGIYVKEEFDDFSLRFGMGKSLLNVIDLRGVKDVVAPLSLGERLLTALRFKKASVLGDKIPQNLKKFENYLNLDGYFDTNCSNCTKE